MFSKNSQKEAIHLMAVGQKGEPGLPGLGEPEGKGVAGKVWMIRQEPLGHLLIFPLGNGAGGIKEESPWGHMAGSIAQNRLLDLHQLPNLL